MKVKAALISFIILGLSYTLFQVFINDTPAMISKQEAEAIASELYGGKVLKSKIDKENVNYQLVIENNKGIYHVSVDGETRQISDVKLIEKKENQLALENKQETNKKEANEKGESSTEASAQNEGNSQTALKEPANNTSYISEQNAKEIAAQQFKGQIKKVLPVDMKTGKHYKVTVDGQSEDAHVYVHASTGEVNSIYRYAKEQQQPQPGARQVESDDDDDDDDDDDGDD